MPWVRAHWRNPPGGGSGTGCGVLIGCAGLLLVGFTLWALANSGSSPPRPTPSVPRASPVARERATEQSHPSRSDLPARDVGLVDTRGGWEWSDRCFRNIQAGNLKWARTECVMGVNLPADSPRPMSSLLYNLGLIEEREGATERAADFYQRSLALYEHPDVRAALARVR